MGTSLPVRGRRGRRRIPGAAAIASSAVRLSGTVEPRRQASSCVISTSQPMSFARSESESAEKPPKTTVCGAPSRVQASIAIGQLGDHAHVDRDLRPLADAELLEHVRHPDDLRLELRVREGAALAFGLALPVVRDPVAEPGLDVTVDAVVRDVERAAQIPLRVGQLPLEQVAERLEPADALAALRLPELLEGAVVDVRLRGRRRRRTQPAAGSAAPRRRSSRSSARRS